MATEIKRRHQLGATIQGSGYGEGFSWLFEGEGDPTTGGSINISLLSDVNAPIGSKYLDLATGDSYVKKDSTPNEDRGSYKTGEWVLAGGSGGGATLPATDTVTGGLIQKYDANSSTLVVNFTGTPIT